MSAETFETLRHGELRGENLRRCLELSLSFGLMQTWAQTVGHSCKRYHLLRVNGVIRAWACQNPYGEPFIGIYVDPAWRRRGLGSRLFAYIADTTGLYGTGVDPWSVPSRSFFQRMAKKHGVKIMEHAEDGDFL